MWQSNFPEQQTQIFMVFLKLCASQITDLMRRSWEEIGKKSRKILKYPQYFITYCKDK